MPAGELVTDPVPEPALAMVRGRVSRLNVAVQVLAESRGYRAVRAICWAAPTGERGTGSWSSCERDQSVFLELLSAVAAAVDPRLESSKLCRCQFLS